MRRSSQETREHVLKVARDLFYFEGIKATGVDTVAREAGIAPTTLYRLFRSKDDLVGAYVQREAELYRRWFVESLGATTEGPRAQLMSLFEALTRQVQEPDCRGCPFQMSLAELSDPELAGHRHARAVKAWSRDRLGELTAELVGPGGAAASELLADQLMVVMEGMYGCAASFGTRSPATSARSLVELLTDRAVNGD